MPLKRQPAHQEQLGIEGRKREIGGWDDGEEEATESRSDGGGKGGRVGGGGGGGGGRGQTWRVKKLLSGCENAAQPKRLSLG